MPDHEDQINSALTEMRVMLATVAGDVRAILGRLDAQGQVQADHERRLRHVEMDGCPMGILARGQAAKATSDIDSRVTSLERWRWSVPSAAVVISVLSLAAVIYGALNH